VLSLDRLLDAALIDGRRAILGPHEPGGSLVAGAPADILTLDTARLTADVVEDAPTLSTSPWPAPGPRTCAALS
jgi:cytosine/adenosine deaminase-related metal-dependent hydrolase